MFALAIALAMIVLPLALMLQRHLQPAATVGAAVRPLDIGELFAVVVAIYGAMPLVGIELARIGIGSIAEQRMGLALPEPAAVQHVGLVHLSLLAGFVAGYAGLRRGARAVPKTALVRARGVHVCWALGLYLGTIGILGLFRIAYGLGQDDDYLATYAEQYALPLLSQQLLGVLSAVDFALAVLCIVVTIAWRPRMHSVVGLVVLALIVQTFVLGGSRTYAFLCGLAYLVARTVYGPRLRWSSLVAYAVLGVFAFLLAGALRQSRMSDEDISALWLLQGGEFVSYFYSGLDLLERAQDFKALGISGALYLVDLLRLLPRQIIGDIKIDPAVLYVSTFYPEFFDAGGGLAFGAVAESVLGYGAPEAAIRGLLLGAAYGWIRNRLQRRHLSVIRVFVYTWFVVLAYQGLRDTTFSVFARFAFQVLPILLCWRMLETLARLHAPRPTMPPKLQTRENTP